MKKLFYLFLASVCILACEKAPEEIAVSAVSLSQPTAEMIIGETVQLIATIVPSNATAKSVIWASSKQSVATVSDSGLVTAISEGTSTITASAGGKSASCTVTVSKKVIEVTSVELDLAELSLEEGRSATLVATVKPVDATDKTVSWSSTDTAIATVDGNGTVSAVKEGTATITAKAGDKQATCVVTVSKKVIAVESITLSKSELQLEKGESEILVAMVKPDNATDKTFTWSSSDDAIATVEQSGKVLATGGGEAIIMAQAGEKTATCKVTVTVPVESISLDNTSLTLEEGQSITLVATVKPDDASDKTVSWSSSDASTVTVDDSGKVVAVKKGTATITAQSGGHTTICTVTVTASFTEPEAIDLGLPSGVKWATFNVGASSPEDFGNYFAWGETETKSVYSWETYKWCSGSQNSLTKYNSNPDFGVVDYKTALDPEDDVAHVRWGDNWRMPTYAEFDELVNECTWASMKMNDVEGKIVIGPNGNSIFLPQAGEGGFPGGLLGDYWSSTKLGDYAQCLYYMNFVQLLHIGGGDSNRGFTIRPVYGVFVPVDKISLDQASISLKSGDSQKLAVTLYPSNATHKTVTWTSSDTKVAEVNSDGVVIAAMTGTVTITAYSSDGTKTATCIVTVDGSIRTPEAVDLGLSVKWASSNLGASSPEEHGMYYAWGETEPKGNYSMATYKWYDGSSHSLTKYCSDSNYGQVDNKTVLDPEDDAAHVKLGGKWRMPTVEEWEELQDKCSMKWTTSYKGTGVAGFIFTGKTPGYTDRSIFLPATGSWVNDTFNEKRAVSYWLPLALTEKLWDGDYEFVRRIYGPTYDNKIEISICNRTNGLTIRPVSE